MSDLIYPGTTQTLPDIFRTAKPIIGTVHLRPLPGAPLYDGESLESILSTALRDVEAYVSGGIDALIVENSGDLPFSKPGDIGMETVAFMTRVVSRIAAETSNVPVGVNCLANAVIPALAVAAAGGASFVRSNQWVNAYVANEGVVEGAAATALRFRQNIHARHVAVLADVHVKHGSHSIVADRPVAEQARDAEFFAADAVIATGSRTGDGTSTDEVESLRAGTSLPVLVGSGLSTKDVDALMAVADGAIVGSSLKDDGVWWMPVNEHRVRDLMARVRELRGE